jgi:hypothetical protein
MSRADNACGNAPRSHCRWQVVQHRGSGPHNRMCADGDPRYDRRTQRNEHALADLCPSTDRCTGGDMSEISDGRVVVDRCFGVQNHACAKNSIWQYDRARREHRPFANPGRWRHARGRMDDRSEHFTERGEALTENSSLFVVANRDDHGVVGKRVEFGNQPEHRSVQLQRPSQCHVVVDEPDQLHRHSRVSKCRRDVGGDRALPTGPDDDDSGHCQPARIVAGNGLGHRNHERGVDHGGEVTQLR